MLTKEIKIHSLEIKQSDLTLSARKYIIIHENGKELNRQSERRAFAPTELDRFKEWSSLDESDPYLTYLEAVWTDEVKAAYRARIEESKKEVQ